MTLADGTVIDMLTGRPVRQSRSIVVPTHQEAVREVTRVRKRVHDLPEAPAKMNAISLVAMYHMFGLSDMDVAYVTGLTEAQVGNIKKLDAYTQMMQTIAEGVAKADVDHVRNTIESHALAAVETVVDVMNSEDEKARLVAAKDILDRAGHRPADVVEHKHKLEGGLTIEYITKDTNSSIPVIDVTEYEAKEN